MNDEDDDEDKDRDDDDEEDEGKDEDDDDEDKDEDDDEEDEDNDETRLFFSNLANADTLDRCIIRSSARFHNNGDAKWDFNHQPHLSVEKL